MIARMDQLTLVGRKSLARDLLRSLQALGVVQVDRLEPERVEGLDAPALARISLEGEDREARDRWVAAAGRADALRSAVDADEVAPAAKADAPSGLDEAETYLRDVGTRVDRLVAERSGARDELEVIRTYLPLYRLLAPTLAQVEGSRYLTAVAFLAPADAMADIRAALEEALEGRLLVTTRPYGREILAVAVALEKDAATLRQAMTRAGTSPLALPPRYRDHGTAKAVHVMEERSQALPRRVSEIDAELAEIGRQHGPRLAATHALAMNHQVRYERLGDMIGGRYAFALRGWVPSADAARVVEALRSQFGDDVVVARRSADEHHDRGVPVKLENPGWARPFQGLLALFAPPKYGNFDPTWTLAVFFPLFFGIVVGDIGFGLLFAALALWMRARGRSGRNLSLGPLGITLKAAALPTIATVILWCSAWSIVWGFVYGEFFGNFLEHWPENNPVFYVPGHGAEGEAHAEGPAEVALEHSAGVEVGDESTPGDVGEHVDEHPGEPAAAVVTGEDGHAQESALADDHALEEEHSGMIPILLFRVEQFTPILVLSLGFGILQVLGGWVIRAYYGYKHHDRKHLWEGIGMFSGLAAIVVFAWTLVSVGMDFGAIPAWVWAFMAVGFAVFVLGVVLSGVALMTIELISNSGNILSYLRLFAVGLSAALVANLATDLGFAISHVAPVIGPILGIVVALSVHMIAIALTIIGHTLQPLRLQYVEFFTKFGFYEESGRPYQPFQLYGGKA